jgi:hypothetical protein
MCITKQVDDWVDFYRRHLRFEVGSNYVIPAQKPGFDRLIVVPKGLTQYAVLRALKGRFGVCSYYKNPDETVTENDRAANSEPGYAIWVRDRLEADMELARMSANDLRQQHIKGITLLERLLLGLKWFTEIGEHLDVESVTLCSGSRHIDGCVPTVSWGSETGKLYVHWCLPNRQGEQLRSRAVCG